jgi:hypothetical protein
VLRNLDNPAPAFSWCDAELRLFSLAYSDLAELASRRASLWQEQGVTPGEVLCIARPLGPDYVVSVVAALKLGVTVSVLPPRGRRFLATRLNALDPTHIDTEDIFLPLLRPWQERVLPGSVSTDRRAAESDRSHSYASGAVAALLFDPSAPECHLPRPLTSDAVYLGALRDGTITLGLRRGHAVTAPGFAFLEMQPAFLLACLQSGATLVHLELSDIERDPSLLTARSFRAAGVDEGLRDLLLRRPLSLRDCWGHWFRNPAGSHQMPRWQRFIRDMGLEGAWCANLKWDAASGGCSLFSAWRRGHAHFDVLPAAGVPWHLANPAHPERASATDHGLLALTPLTGEDREPSATGNIIARQGSTWIFAGTRETTRRGHRYPSREVLAALAGTPGCHGLSVCEVPQVGGDGHSITVLMVFVSREAAKSEAPLRREIEQRIASEMGVEFTPDRIQLFPLVPRRDPEGGVDHRWCREQYLSGALFKKSRDELYGCLSLLREQVIKTEAADASQPGDGK